jgi:Tat (twin-arginine translocation) pathway signal sequence
MAQKITRRQMLYLAAGGVAALAAGGIIYTWQQTPPAPTQTTTQTQTSAQTQTAQTHTAAQTANQPRKLAILARSGYHQEINKALMEYYNSKKPPVEFNYVGKGYFDTYQVAVLAMRNKSTDYDVMYLDEPWLYEFYVNGWLEPLGDVDTSGIPQAIADLGKYKGVTYAMPITGNFNFMFYNKELLDKVGESPPKSWDDVLRIAEAVNQKLAPKSYGWSGFYSGGVVSDVYATVLLSLGGHLFDPKDRVTPMLDTPEAVEALKIVRDLASPKRGHPKTISWSSNAEFSDAILNGEVAMGAVWNGWVKDVDDPSRSKCGGADILYTHAWQEAGDPDRRVVLHGAGLQQKQGTGEGLHKGGHLPRGAEIRLPQCRPPPDADKHIRRRGGATEEQTRQDVCRTRQGGHAREDKPHIHKAGQRPNLHS